MQISQRSVVARLPSRSRFFIAYTQVLARAQQPEPLRLTAPAPHALQGTPPPAQAQLQTQTAQGELLDVDAKASTLTIKTPTAEMTFRYNDQTKVTGVQKGAVRSRHDDRLTGDGAVQEGRPDEPRDIDRCSSAVTK